MHKPLKHVIYVRIIPRCVTLLSVRHFTFAVMIQDRKLLRRKYNRLIIERGKNVADQTDTGMVFSNHPTWTKENLPFGRTNAQVTDVNFQALV